MVNYFPMNFAIKEIDYNDNKCFSWCNKEILLYYEFSFKFHSWHIIFSNKLLCDIHAISALVRELLFKHFIVCVLLFSTYCVLLKGINAELALVIRRLLVYMIILLSVVVMTTNILIEIQHGLGLLFITFHMIMFLKLMIMLSRICLIMF